MTHKIQLTKTKQEWRFSMKTRLSYTIWSTFSWLQIRIKSETDKNLTKVTIKTQRDELKSQKTDQFGVDGLVSSGSHDYAWESLWTGNEIEDQKTEIIQNCEERRRVGNNHQIFCIISFQEITQINACTTYVKIKDKIKGNNCYIYRIKKIDYAQGPNIFGPGPDYYVHFQ